MPPPLPQSLCFALNLAGISRARIGLIQTEMLLRGCSAECRVPLNSARAPNVFGTSQWRALKHHNNFSQVRLSMSIRGGNEVGECTPDDVIKFWFGDEIYSDKAAMDTGAYLERMGARWFFSTPEFDKEVQEKFADVIRAAADGRLSAEWDGEKGRLARILLFDQLSRNAFRGTPEAFQYDAPAVQLARSALAEDLSSTPISVVQFTLMPLMHSESIQDQDALVAKIQERAAVGGAAALMGYMMEAAEDHRAVIQRFGRFPHRNSKYGRDTTAEEAEWLASPDCPSWAKSQA